MPRKPIVLKNRRQSVTFAGTKNGYRPEWFRLGTRPMLRFKDHEFLNIGGVRVTEGQLLEETAGALAFGGEVVFAGVKVGWLVRVERPDDGGPGFTVATHMVPLEEPIEVLEAMSAFELPYEYDGSEHLMTVMSQQPVYQCEGGKEITGAGYMHPNWYYGKTGRAHLTFPSNSPLMINRVRNADGTNERCTMFVGNWNACSVEDMFAQPTRVLGRTKADTPFDDKKLRLAPGLRGMKFLVGCLNWNTSLHKDPNVIVDPGEGLSQEVTIDFANALPGDGWDTWLAAGWERMAAIHFPEGGYVPAWEVAKSRGASWVESAEWLTDQFKKPEGCPGFFYPGRGTCVYAPGTRPKWDSGVKMFCGQWVGPVSYLGHVWKDKKMIAATERLEKLFTEDTAHQPERVGTIGPTPQIVAVIRKAALMGATPAAMAKIKDWVTRRTAAVLDPSSGSRRGDAGIYAWDALLNLLAADLFDRSGRETAAKQLLEHVLRELDGKWWSFNCAAVGDFVSAGGGRPFGHGIAMTANLLAYRRFGDEKYLHAAERLGNILLGMHIIPCNSSESPDLDTRGWANGSTAGRDQLCHMPPWETAHALLQLAYAIDAGIGRDGFYDALWLFAHTGLAMFPKARTMKRLYAPDMTVTYRQIDSVATEREFYLKLPYLAYEEPWDQTMLAGYQGVEPIILSLFLGGGLVAAEDERVLALVPQAPLYDKNVAKEFAVHLWNPLAEPIHTRLCATVAQKRGETWTCTGTPAAKLTPGEPFTKAVDVPPREEKKLVFRRA